MTTKKPKSTRAGKRRAADQTKAPLRVDDGTTKALIDLQGRAYVIKAQLRGVQAIAQFNDHQKPSVGDMLDIESALGYCVEELERVANEMGNIIPHYVRQDGAK